MRIVVDDLSGPEIAAFLQEHVDEMRSITPLESKHALDLDGLRQPEITFWSVLDGDSVVCEGVGQLRGADLSSFNDHRVLMALAVAGSRSDGESRLTYPHAYRISYPGFLDDMTSLGMNLAVDRAAGL